MGGSPATTRGGSLRRTRAEAAEWRRLVAVCLEWRRAGFHFWVVWAFGSAWLIRCACFAGLGGGVLSIFFGRAKIVGDVMGREEREN